MDMLMDMGGQMELTGRGTRVTREVGVAVGMDTGPRPMVPALIYRHNRLTRVRDVICGLRRVGFSCFVPWRNERLILELAGHADIVGTDLSLDCLFILGGDVGDI